MDASEEAGASTVSAVSSEARPRSRISSPQQVLAALSLVAAAVPAQAEVQLQELKPAHFPALQSESGAAAVPKVVVAQQVVPAESS